MEPEIRYCTTSDGVSIAYYSMGEGLPLVVTSGILWSSLRMQLFREYHRSSSGNGLGRDLQIVRYDARGTGLSDRHSLDFSLEARLVDLDAVIERLKLERFAVFGRSIGAQTAVAYAAAHPERVSHLILVDAFARSGDFNEANRAFASLRDMADEEWERYWLVQSNRLLDFGSSELARHTAMLARESITPEGLRALNAVQSTIDVTPILARVAVPTLVLYRAHSGPTVPLELSKHVAAKIPDARFAAVAVTDDFQWTDEETCIVEKFLGVEPVPVPVSRAEVSAATPSGMAVILFTDIVDSTALTERHGDAAFHKAARALDVGLRAAIRDEGGTAIEGKLLGDGVMGVFSSASQAIAAARRCIELSAKSELRLHVGLHAGDVIREAGNVYGGAVNIAARICALSAPGEVLVSEIVRGLARTSAGVEFEDLGEHEMKGVSDPVRVYSVHAE
jgi:class 3 adenylate cyclase/pimeloyl-ACP methyl ester carboxylesterase